MNENKQVASNYVITFYNEVQTFSSYTGQYITILAKFKNKYATDEITKIDVEDSDKAILMGLLNNISYSLYRCNLNYNVISSSLNIKVDEKINSLYKKLKEQYVFNADLLEEYDILINKALMNDLIKQLIALSQDTLVQMRGLKNA